MKKARIIVVALACLLVSQVSFAATHNSIGGGLRTVTVNGQRKNVNMVMVNLNDKNLYLDANIANNKIGGHESFSNMIGRKAPLASINANYFDAYKTLEPMGSIMREGRMEYLEGSSASLIATKDGHVSIGQYSFKIKGYINGLTENAWNNETQTMDFATFNIWYVNKVPSDKSGVYMYTPARGNTIKLSGGIAIEVKNNKVTRVVKGAQQTIIPKDGYIIYYGTDVGGASSYVDQRFKVGNTVELEYEVTNQGQALPVDKSLQAKNNLKTIVSAGPYLVEDGKNVFNAKNSGSTEAKINVNRAQRSAVGITKTNKLIMVTGANLNMNELAQAMIQLGAVRAMNLDGGASSALYGNGKTYTSPGRKLHTVLNVHQKLIKK